MTKVTYHIVPHDGGWAYRPKAPSRRLSRPMMRPKPPPCARRRSSDAPGETAAISWEGVDGKWHEELASGRDRPETDVEGEQSMLPPGSGLSSRGTGAGQHRSFPRRDAAGMRPFCIFPG